MKFFKKNISKVTILMFVGMALFGGYTVINNDYTYIAGLRNCIVSPLLRIQGLVADTVRSITDYFESKKMLQNKIKELEENNIDLQDRLIDLEAARLFSDETQELIEYRKNYAVKDAQLAQILLTNLDDIEHACFVDCGSNHQILIDSCVVYKNCLLGRVVQVFPSYSKVMLITDRNSKVAVICAHTKTAGIWEGMSNQAFGKLRHISHMQPLEQSDILLSTGEGLIYPYGFCVGTIADFERTSVDYNVTVTPALDITKLRYCYVIPPKNAIVSVADKTDSQF